MVGRSLTNILRLRQNEYTVLRPLQHRIGAGLAGFGSVVDRGALQPLLHRHRVNAEVFRDLLDRDFGFAVAGDAQDVVTEFGGIGLGTMPSFQAALPGKPDQMSPIRAAVPRFKTEGDFMLACVWLVEFADANAQL